MKVKSMIAGLVVFDEDSKAYKFNKVGEVKDLPEKVALRLLEETPYIKKVMEE